jgi:rSAM/selenodomain-associated transferase 1
MTTTLAIIAKAPQAGHSKTRLCPPLTFTQAAQLAEAALRDTLAAVLATPADRRVVVLDGACGAWLPAGVDVIRQRGDGLGARLANAFDELGGPTLLVGMDTPQLTPALLSAGLDALRRGAAATLGLAPDGGYWAIGMRSAEREVFTGVPMSTDDTGAVQLARLRHVLRCEPHRLPALRDVDFIDDARAAAAAAPSTFFAGVLSGMNLEDRAAA